MRNIIISIIILSAALASCSKSGEPRTVKYYISGLAEPFTITYQKEDTVIQEIIDLESINDVWTYSFEAEQGHITYLYLESQEEVAASMELLISINIDNKVFRQSEDWDGYKVAGDTVFYVHQRGTVPFME